MMNTTPTRQHRPSEDGYILLAVMIMLAILIISMSVAAPAIKKQIQRDRDVETMHRGKQYIRALKLYYKKFGAYPPNVDALVMTNNIRYLRKKYVDPTTGKDVWTPIHFGQNKAPLAMGFFGQPIGGSVVAPTGPMGGSGLGGSGLGASPTGAILPGGIGPSSPDSGANPVSAINTPGSSGTNGSTGPAVDANGNPINGTAGTGLTGQTFGGGGIIGFSPGSDKQSILVYKKKNHYNEWEFTYSPLAEQMMMQGGMQGGNNPLGQQPTGIQLPGNMGGPGITSGPGQGGFNPGFGNSPPAPTTPSPPQQ